MMNIFRPRIALKKLRLRWARTIEMTYSIIQSDYRLFVYASASSLTPLLSHRFGGLPLRGSTSPYSLGQRSFKISEESAIFVVLVCPDAGAPSCLTARCWRPTSAALDTAETACPPF